MNSSGPWWATPLFTLAGVLFTIYVSGQRESRFRWNTEKRAAYAEFLIACKTLRDTRVWPEDRGTEPADPAPAAARIADLAEHTALIASRAVAGRIGDAVSAGRRFASVLARIRQDSKPGHQGSLDERQRPAFEEALNAFTDSVNAFTNAARADIGVRRRVMALSPAEESAQ